MSLLNLLEFHVSTNSLKRTERYSSCPEVVRDSPADHSWGVGLLLCNLHRKGIVKDIDFEYAMNLALTHDLCECGKEQDFDSYLVATGVQSETEKKKSETEVVQTLSQRFEMPEVLGMWKDYEKGRTKEARVVKALDKIEAIIHIINVGGSHRKGVEDYDHIAKYADKSVMRCPELKPFLRIVKDRLKALYKEQGVEWKPDYDLV